MKLSPRLQVIAAMVGMHSKDFSIGWANGMVRWEGRVRTGVVAETRHAGYVITPCSFAPGSVKWAASEAAITFMKELDP